jgi:phospho-N-acetylmuramoyl-pentapeptide-transferase
VSAFLAAGGMALLISILGTPLLITWLRKRGIGQQIREDGPSGHFSKAGTPTMGGVAIIFAAVAGYLFAHVTQTFTTRGIVGMLAVCGAAAVGFADDWIKNTHQRRDSWRWRWPSQ